MKRLGLNLTLFIWQIFVFIPNGSLLADQVVPPTAGTLVGDWIGYEDGGLVFYRISLASRGQGSCALLFNDSKLDAYTINDWHVGDGKLSLRLSPKSQNAEPIVITVNYVDALKMELVVSGIENKWHRKAMVFNEQEFNKRAKATAKQVKRSVPRINSNE